MKKSTYDGISTNYGMAQTVKNVKDSTQNWDYSNGYIKEVLCLPGQGLTCHIFFKNADCACNKNCKLNPLIFTIDTPA